MDHRQTVTDEITSALRAAGFAGIEAKPHIGYRKGRADVWMFGGPPASFVEDILTRLVDQGVIKRFSVDRSVRYTCGEFHDSGVHAWFAHEGRQHAQRLHGDDCELGCDHSVPALTEDTMARLVADGETFISRECVEVAPTPVTAG